MVLTKGLPRFGKRTDPGSIAWIPDLYVILTLRDTNEIQLNRKCYCAGKLPPSIPYPKEYWNVSHRDNSKEQCVGLVPWTGRRRMSWVNPLSLRYLCTPGAEIHKGSRGGRVQGELTMLQPCG
jgi:hypothetical protein